MLEHGREYFPHKIVSTYKKILVVWVPVLLYLFFSWPLVYNVHLGYAHCGVDAAYYTESAKAFPETGEFLCRPWSGMNPANSKASLSLWPVGFPLLMSMLVKIGMDPFNAGILLSYVSVGLALLLITKFYAEEEEILPALCMGILLCFSVYIQAIDCRSEGPFLLFSVISILSIRHALNQCVLRYEFRWLFIAGFLGGFAWSIRNVGVALFIATILYLLCLPPRQFKLISLRLGLYIGGWFLSSLGFIVRNIVVFGKFNPYWMPPSTRPFLVNCIDMIKALGYEFLASYHKICRHILGESSAKIEILCVIVLALLVLWKLYVRHSTIGAMLRHDIRTLCDKNFFCAYLLLYAAGICGTAIVARSVYEQGHIMDARMIFPITWIGYFFFIILIRKVIKVVLPSFSVVFEKVVLTTIILLAFVLPIRRFTQYELPMNRVSIRQTMENCRIFISKNQYLISDQIGNFRGLADVGCRYSGHFSYTLQDITQAEISGELWGFAVLNQEHFLASWENEESKKMLLEPLFAHPEQFSQYEVIHTPYYTMYRYVLGKSKKQP